MCSIFSDVTPQFLGKIKTYEWITEESGFPSFWSFRDISLAPSISIFPISSKYFNTVYRLQFSVIPIFRRCYNSYRKKFNYFHSGLSVKKSFKYYEKNFNLKLKITK